MSEALPADGTELDDAFSALGDSMAGLSADLTDLGDAVAELEASTQRLSDTQQEVSQTMDETAASLLDGDDLPSARASPTAQSGLVADD